MPFNHPGEVEHFACFNQTLDHAFSLPGRAFSFTTTKSQGFISKLRLLAATPD